MKSIIAVAAAVALAAGNAFAETGGADQQNLADRQQIVDTIMSVGYYADQRQWDKVQSAFADSVILDYTSSATAAAGQAKPEPLSPDRIVSAWQTQLPGYEHTQHIVSVVAVSIIGDKATAISNVFATHILPATTGEGYWIFIGTYDHELIRTAAGWRISLMRANKRAELGNPDLPNLASARVKAGQIATAP